MAGCAPSTPAPTLTATPNVSNQGQFSTPDHVSPTETALPTPIDFTWVSVTTEPVVWHPDSPSSGLPPGAVWRVGFGNPLEAALSPDGLTLAVGTEAQIVLLDANTLDLLWAASISSEIRGMAWSPDGKQIAVWTTEDHRLSFFNTTSGHLLRVKTFTEEPMGAAWSPDGAEIAVAAGYSEYGKDPASIIILNNASTVLRSFPLPERTNPANVTWSPDGQLIAVGTYDGGYLLRSDSGEQVLPGQVEANKFRFNPAGTMLAGTAGTLYFSDAPGASNRVLVWDLQTLEQRVFTHTSEYPSSVTEPVWSPDGKYLMAAAGSPSSGPRDALIWDVHSGDVIQTLNIPMWAASMVWSPDGSQIAVGGYHTDSDRDGADRFQNRIVVFRRGIDQPELALVHRRIGYGIQAMAWLPDGKSFISVGDTIIRWDARSAKPLASVQALASLEGQMWAEDGDKLISDPSASYIPVYERWGQPTSALSPDGTLLAAEVEHEGNPSTVMITEAASGQQLFEFTGIKKDVYQLVWSPDGTRLAAGVPYIAQPDPYDWSGMIYLWDTATGSLITTTEIDGGMIFDLAWSPDGRRLAVAQGAEYGCMCFSYLPEDYSVPVLDGYTGKLIHNFLGHTSFVFDVKWSPDGSLLASGSDDGTVLVWKIP
jgi:WD40 repeat protein